MTLGRSVLSEGEGSFIYNPDEEDDDDDDDEYEDDDEEDEDEDDEGGRRGVSSEPLRVCGARPLFNKITGGVA